MGLLDLLLGKDNPATTWAGENRGYLTGLSTSLLSDGMNFAPAAQGAAMDREAATKREADAKLAASTNATKQWLQQKYPDLAQAVDAGLPVSEAWNEAFKRQQPGYGQTEALKPIEINGQLVDPNTYKVVGDYRTADTTKVPAAPAGYQFKPDGTLGFIPGGPADPSTAGKTTEATRRNQQLASVIAPELASLMGDGATPGTFDALANGWDQAKGFIPGGNMVGATATSPEYQKATDSLKTIVSSYLYSVSGATANPGEVANQVDILTPKPGDSPQRVQAKKDRVVEMVNAVKAAATGVPIDINNSGGGGAADPLGIR